MFSRTFIQKIKSAQSVAVLTGAGISAESGVPTFRDPGGIWQKFRPEQLANFEAFISDPDFVWQWYQERRKIIKEVNPNSGHYALAEMEKLFPCFNLITQNIDNLHKRAGSRKVIELHGNIERNYCIRCLKFYDNMETKSANVPRCECGGLIRPDVVWFGEMLPHEELSKAEKCTKTADVFLSIGTSAEVYPAALLPIFAKSSGAYVVEINIKPTIITEDVDEHICGNSSLVLSELLKLLKGNDL